MKPVSVSVSSDNAFYKRTADEWSALLFTAAPHEDWRNDSMTRREFQRRMNLSKT